MGTRAQFFIGNPSDLTGRKWLGTVAWDGYPDGDCGRALNKVATEEQFIVAVQMIASKRDDFCDPAKHSFPFPWLDDLYLTDCTYAFFDGEVQFTYYHHGFIPLKKYLEQSKQERDAYYSIDRLPDNALAPSSDLPKGPDSIIMISVR